MKDVKLEAINFLLDCLEDEHCGSRETYEKLVEEKFDIDCKTEE